MSDTVLVSASVGNGGVDSKMSDLLVILLVSILAAIVGWLIKKNSGSGCAVPHPDQEAQIVHHPVLLKDALSSSAAFRLVIFPKPLSPRKVRPPEWLVPDPLTYSLLLSPAFCTFLQLTGSATRTIDVASYIFTGRLILTALREAVEKGVKVRVIVDGFDQKRKAAKSFERDGSFGQTLTVEELAKHGLNVREYSGQSRRGQEAAWEKEEAREARYGKRHFIPVRERTPTKPLCMFHCKHVVVDGRVVMFGSCNISEDSFATHFEDFVITNDQRFVEPFRAQFQDVWHDFRV